MLILWGQPWTSHQERWGKDVLPSALSCPGPFVRWSSFCCWLSLISSDASHDAAAEAIENMADAVTHARFVGTDPASDEVVLMKILQVHHLYIWHCLEVQDRLRLSCLLLCSLVLPQELIMTAQRNHSSHFACCLKYLHFLWRVSINPYVVTGQDKSAVLSQCLPNDCRFL